MKYGAPDGNRIGISASPSKNGGPAVVEICVTDRGPGIPPEEREYIFDPFFRGRRPLKDQIHGTGLGLNLVKRIIEAHGGTVAVRDKPGPGAELIVRIPVAPPDALSAIAPFHKNDQNNEPPR
jgi:signal transduction histidine kinase